jgi:hypothetical protein
MELRRLPVVEKAAHSPYGFLAKTHFKWPEKAKLTDLAQSVFKNRWRGHSKIDIAFFFQNDF